MPGNYYMLLGIERGAGLPQIKRAYRRAIKRYHPDRGGSGTDADKFRAAREAYEVLSDHDRRRAYDAELRREGIPVEITNTREAVRSCRNAWRAGGHTVSLLDTLFEGLVPGIHRQGLPPHKAPGDLYMEVVLTPEEAQRGGTYPITIAVPRPCPRWHRRAGGMLFCPTCRGRGTVSVRREFNLVIPPDVANGASTAVSLGPVGLQGVRLVIDIRVATH